MILPGGIEYLKKNPSLELCQLGSETPLESRGGDIKDGLRAFVDALDLIIFQIDSGMFLEPGPQGVG